MFIQVTAVWFVCAEANISSEDLVSSSEVDRIGSNKCIQRAPCDGFELPVGDLKAKHELQIGGEKDCDISDTITKAGEIAASTNAKVASVALNDPIPTATCEQNREPNGQQSLKHDHKSIDVRIVAPHENVSGVLDESRTARGMPVVVPREEIVPRESTGAQVLWKLIIFLETN